MDQSQFLVDGFAPAGYSSAPSCEANKGKRVLNSGEPPRKKKKKKKKRSPESCNQLPTIPGNFYQVMETLLNVLKEVPIPANRDGTEAVPNSRTMAQDTVKLTLTLPNVVEAGIMHLDKAMSFLSPLFEQMMEVERDALVRAKEEAQVEKLTDERATLMEEMAVIRTKLAEKRKKEAIMKAEVLEAKLVAMPTWGILPSIFRAYVGAFCEAARLLQTRVAALPSQITEVLKEGLKETVSKNLPNLPTNFNYKNIKVDPLGSYDDFIGGLVSPVLDVPIVAASRLVAEEGTNVEMVELDSPGTEEAITNLVGVDPLAADNIV